jgi:hypothetical protein
MIVRPSIVPLNSAETLTPVTRSMSDLDQKRTLRQLTIDVGFKADIRGQA